MLYITLHLFSCNSVKPVSVYTKFLVDVRCNHDSKNQRGTSPYCPGCKYSLTLSLLAATFVVIRASPPQFKNWPMCVQIVLLPANSLDTDQDRQNVGPDLYPNCMLH